MKKDKQIIPVLIMSLIAIVAIAVIMLLAFGGNSAQNDEDVTKPKTETIEKAEEEKDEDDEPEEEEDDIANLYLMDWYDHDAAPDKEYYGTLENGDTYYTPDGSHLVFDDGRAILYYNNMLIAYTYTDLSEADIDALAKIVGGEVVGIVSGGIHSVQLKVADTDLAGLESLADKLMDNDSVMYACAEFPVQIMADQNNPWGEYGYDILGDEDEPDGSDWWAEAIGAYTAWEYSDHCQDISIGVADTGVDVDHEDLKGSNITVIGNNTVDSMDHGTHVAGIMSAADNNVGIRGIADKLHLYSADLWTGADSDSSFHTVGELMALYNFMAQHGVRAVNNSWGCYIYGDGFYEELSEGNSLSYDEWYKKRIVELEHSAEATIVMISQLIESGYDKMVFVQAAGNGYYDYSADNADAITNGYFSSVTEDVFNGLDQKILDHLNKRGVTYKDIDDRIFIVTAVDYFYDDNGVEYELTEFANYGDTVDICAPGNWIYSTMNSYGESYFEASGTSMAAPMVTSSIGFVWSLDPELTVSEIREIIFSSAQVEVECEFDGKTYTYPMVNVGAAAQKVMGE